MTSTSGLRADLQHSPLPLSVVRGIALLGLIAAAFLALASGAAVAGPTPEDYKEHAGGEAQIVQPGNLRIDGHKIMCGERPTVLDNTLDDYGAAYPGFLILNPKLMNKVSTPVKMWIYSHECGHQFRGPDEETADCFAVQRGRRQGWLNADGLAEICKFISPAKGDSMHFSGSYRCEKMRQCFEDPAVR